MNRCDAAQSMQRKILVCSAYRNTTRKEQKKIIMIEILEFFDKYIPWLIGICIRGHIASLMIVDGKELANDWGNRHMLLPLSDFNKYFAEDTQSLSTGYRKRSRIATLQFVLKWQ